jgi:hypothetical protein
VLTPIKSFELAPLKTVEEIFADMRRDMALWAEFADKVDAIIAEKQAERASFRRPA